MNLDEIIQQMERDRAGHMTSGVSDAEELRQLEAALGLALPASVRAILERAGGGIYYGRHEIFGGHPVTIHDIELVPSMRAMTEHLRSGRPGLPDGWLPFHRAEGVVHAIHAVGGEVAAWPSGARYPTLESFLQQVVLGRVPPRPGMPGAFSS